VADAVEHLVSVEPANGLLDAVNHYFVATGCAPTAEQDLDENETIRVETTAWRDLRDAVLAGELRGGKAVVGVCYYELAR
jgi:ADP-ribose pyrophosphatase